MQNVENWLSIWCLPQRCQAVPEPALKTVAVCGRWQRNWATPAVRKKGGNGGKNSVLWRHSLFTTTRCHQPLASWVFCDSSALIHWSWGALWLENIHNVQASKEQMCEQTRRTKSHNLATMRVTWHIMSNEQQFIVHVEPDTNILCACSYYTRTWQHVTKYEQNKRAQWLKYEHSGCLSWVHKRNCVLCSQYNTLWDIFACLCIYNRFLRRWMAIFCTDLLKGQQYHLVQYLSPPSEHLIKWRQTMHFAHLRTLVFILTTACIQLVMHNGTSARNL